MSNKGNGETNIVEVIDVTGPPTARGRRTRLALIAAARTVFERDGFQAARISDISQLAGMAHGTFYTYFDSKEEAFAAIIDQLRDEMLGRDDAHRHAGASDGAPMRPIESIKRANERYVTAFQRNSRMMVVWEEVATFTPDMASLLYENKMAFVRRAERAIREWQRTGAVDARLDARYTAHALTGMVSRFAYTWFAQREEFDFETAVEQLTLLWANALGLETDWSDVEAADTRGDRSVTDR